jgi:NAD+ kinase
MSDQRKSILLVGLADKQESVAAIESHRPWLERRCRVVGEVYDEQSPLTGAGEADFVVTFGGDGLLLSTARRMQLEQVPIIGVNLGTLGYMAEFGVEELRSQLDAILSGRLPPQDRMMLDCCVRDGGAERFRTVALNDVVVTGGPNRRIIGMQVTINGRPVTTVYGDGLIVATPTGSTAYSLASGGPILHPRLNALCVTPICPHALTHRPLVLTDDAQVQIDITRQPEGARVVVDGQLASDLAEDGHVIVRKAEVTVRLVENPAHTPYEMMQSKLNWGRPALYGAE